MIRKSLLALAAATALTTGVLADHSLFAQQPAGQMAAEDDAISQNPDRAFAVVFISHARLQRLASEMVAQKATTPGVKQLAQEIATDHQQISQRVQQAAQKEGIQVDPDRLLPRDQAVLNYMQRLPVSSLERDYVFFEAGATQTNTLFAQWAAKNAQRPGIKELAQEVADKLQQRSQTIQQLAQNQISGGQ
jgi:predicted outer membrane protein